MEKYKIVMLGEKDHGKSTLLANLLIASKSVSHERINEVKNISKKNKTRFEPAYILDAFSEERDLGMTIDTTRANIAYKNKLIELIDVPGHLELIKNMMTGASNSEIAVLVVSAKKNEGFKLETKRHLFLASMFNLKTVIIAVNKMDELDYNEKIFNRLKKQINDFLNMLDIKIKPIFIPISAYDNENLTVKSQKIKWYNGKSLLETITGLKNNKKGNGKNKNKIRVLIQDTFDENNKSFSGIIYSGKLIKNSKIKILPKNIKAKIKSVSFLNRSSKSSNLKNVLISFFDKDLGVKRGDIIYDLNSDPSYLDKFRAKIFLINNIDLKNLKNIKIIFNNNEFGINKINILKAISPLSGKLMDLKKIIKPDYSINAEINLNCRYPIEKFNEFEEFGRFLIFNKNKFAGIGIVF